MTTDPDEFFAESLPKLIIILICIAVFGSTVAGCSRNGSSGEEKVTVPLMKNVDDNHAIPKGKPCKLVFIHHSVGGHWLAHGNGDLVRELNRNGFYVNDITYGWESRELSNGIFRRMKRTLLHWLKMDNDGAYGVGDRTDIGQMYDWFAGPDSPEIMAAVYRENNETDRFGNHGNDRALDGNAPPGENEIVMFKSCYPNTLLRGRPEDKANGQAVPPKNYGADSELHTIANAKRTFNEVLKYFGSRPDKFFVVVTPPPRLELPEDGRIARGFANWLTNDWLKENRYPYRNVMVFDLYNVLTSSKAAGGSDVGEEGGNHHRMWQGKEQHIVSADRNTLAYPRKAGDNHPSPEGLEKATAEFVPLLVERHRLWKQGLPK